MQVSFKGIKNPGAYAHRQEYLQIIRTNYQDFILPKGRSMNFHCELTNENGNDLDEFKQILTLCPNKYNKNAINIGYDWYINPNNGQRTRIFAINDAILDINEGTFNIFNKIFKLMKKVANMPAEQIKVDNKYLRTEEARDSFSNYILYEKDGNIERILDKAHQRDNIKSVAGDISQKYARALSDYILS